MSDADAPNALGPNAAQVRALASGDPQKALQILERAVAFDPDNLAAWLNYGGLLRSVSRADEAMAAIGQALRIQPRSFHALLMKGSILDSQGKSADAGRAYGLALMFAPADGEPFSVWLVVLEMLVAGVATGRWPWRITWAPARMALTGVRSSWLTIAAMAARSAIAASAWSSRTLASAIAAISAIRAACTRVQTLSTAPKNSASDTSSTGRLCNSPSSQRATGIAASAVR